MEAMWPSVRCWEKVAPTMITALSSAFFEWVLIFMLFIDGGFGYLITKFAQYCQLQLPCLFCSRLDHVLGKERAGFYWDLVCYNHKLNISSLILCHLHDNLVDVHGMCERCLFSFETVNKLHTETYRSIVGKLGADEDPLLEELSSSSKRNCFCCKEPCVSKGFAKKLLEIKPVGSEAAKFDEEGIRNQFLNFPPLECKKVKITSDSESDAAISDNDTADLLIREKDYSRQDSFDRCMHPEPQNIAIAEDKTSEKLIHPSSVSEPPLLDSELQLEDRCSTSNQPSAADLDHPLREINSSQAERGSEMSAPSQLKSFFEVPPSPKLESSAAIVTTELEKEMAKAGSDFIPSSSEMLLDSKPDTTDTSAQMATSLDLGDAYKLATSTRVRQLSGKFLKQMSLNDSTQTSEDLKLLLSQFSANRGMESSLNDISTRLSVNSDELKGSDTSTSIGIHMIQRKISLERNESNVSLDGSTVSEIEGESMVERLKRQVEHDKRFISALYKELEEERSASAVAANQAMAMITRLQEEKSALQMEALQCLRMMEEQADFDNEALQKANENVMEMEKMVQDLEADLGEYRKKYGDITLLKNVEATCESNVRAIRAESSEGTSDNVLGDFENENLYIMRCLKKLEEKLQLFSNNASADVINSEFSGEEWVNVSNPIELDNREDCRGNSETEDSHLQQDAIKEKGIHCPQELSTKLGNAAGGIGLDALRNEVSTLTDRLKLLEAEHNIIQHSINSLGNGEEGLKFIQEIAGYLQKLHLRKDWLLVLKDSNHHQMDKSE